MGLKITEAHCVCTSHTQSKDPPLPKERFEYYGLQCSIERITLSALTDIYKYEKFHTFPNSAECDVMLLTTLQRRLMRG